MNKKDNFFNNERGAVTVLVTLMLIPVMLITGMSVDLTRIYTANSLLTNANELAGNALLTEYDALLQDLYGIYAITTEDEELKVMVNEYIEIALFNENEEKELGTLQPFYGSKKEENCNVEWSKSLAEQQVLKRQIEEYAKYRVPVYMIEDFFKIIEQFEKIQEDAEIIDDMKGINKEIESMLTNYENIYKMILIIDNFRNIEKEVFTEINTMLNLINKQFVLLFDLSVSMSGHEIEPEQLEDYEQKFNDILNNIKTIAVNGGTIKTEWVDGKWDEEKTTWTKGEWESSKNIPMSLQKLGTVSASSVRDYFVWNDEQSVLINGEMVELQTKKWFLDNPTKNIFEFIVNEAKDAEKSRVEIKVRIEGLEDKIAEGKCSKDFGDSLTHVSDKEEEKGQIQRYKELLEYNNVKQLVEGYRNESKKYIDDVTMLIEKPMYATFIDNIEVVSNNHADLTLEQLKTLNNEYKVINGELNYGVDEFDKLKDKVYGYSNATKSNLVHFKNMSDEHEKFYEVLEGLFSESKETNKKNTTKALDSIKKVIQETLSLDVFFANEDRIEGAIKLPNDTSDKKENKIDAEKLMDEDGEDNFFEDNFFDKLIGVYVSKLLLVGYNTKMFSHYMSKEGEITLTGIPLSTEVNYFYHSELEYLYNGSSNAVSNVNSVIKLIYTVRFVCNFISTFSISSVNNEINNLSAWAGPFAPLLNITIRLVYAGGESAIDMQKMLKMEGNKKVPGAVKLLKFDSKDWSFSLEGVLEDIVLGTLEATEDKIFGNDFTKVSNDTKNEDVFELGYYDYLKIFLLFKEEDEMLINTSKLIELNLTTYKSGGALQLEEKSGNIIDLGTYVTGFTINTSVEAKMLFLSMPFAQNSIEEILPKTYDVRSTVTRGY